MRPLTYRVSRFSFRKYIGDKGLTEIVIAWMLSPLSRLSESVPAMLSPPKNLGVLWEDLALFRTVRIAQSLPLNVERNTCSTLSLRVTGLLGTNVEYLGKPRVRDARSPDKTVEYRGRS
jgi:hypothetical protein